MKISDKGLDLIKSFEGYHTRMKNGDCVAYKCPAGVWTIGWGCTEGIKPGMVWSEAEAEAALRGEIAKFEDGVNQLITEPMNQNEFDAFVSLAYNIGLTGFKRSSVRGFFNQRKKPQAAKAFELWTRGGGRTLPGLVSRRKREAALFLKPVEKPEDPYMPQKVDPAPPPASSATVPIATTSILGIATAVLSPDVAIAHPWLAVGVLLSVAGLFALPWIVPAAWRPA
jgi:lysozyme